MIVHYSHKIIIKCHTGDEIDPVACLNKEDDERQSLLANRVPCNPNRINSRRIVNSNLSSNSSESVEVHSDFSCVKALKKCCTETETERNQKSLEVTSKKWEEKCYNIKSSFAIKEMEVSNLKAQNKDCTKDLKSSCA